MESPIWAFCYKITIYLCFSQSEKHEKFIFSNSCLHFLLMYNPEINGINTTSFKGGSAGAGWGESLTSGSEDEPTGKSVGLVYLILKNRQR